MAINNGQKGFWVKRTSDTAPQFISVGGLEVPDSVVEQSKKEWSSRKGYTGDMAANNVDWVGDNPNTFATDIVSSGAKQFSGATPDFVEDTYFDTLLKQTEEEFYEQRRSAQDSQNNLVKYIKQDRQLFDKDLQRNYAKSLQKVQENAYSRGVGDSGIKQGDYKDIADEKDFQVEKQNLYESQKLDIAAEDLQNRLRSINRSEARARSSLKSPYAKFQF